MELKRILANDAKTANDRAMALYGRDVLVISNHTVGGQTELIVALDIDEQGPDPTVQIAGKSSPPRDPLLSFGSQMALAQNKARPSAKAPVKLEQTAPPAAAEFVPANLASIELDAPFDREVIEQILDELKALRREVSLSQKTSGWHSGLDLAPEVDSLLSSFTQAGMPSGLRTLLLDTVKDMRSEKEALEAVRQQLEQVVHRPSQALPLTGIHLVAGPTGTGKTLSLMISKLDESVQPWPLVDFLCDNFIALSAASDGADPGGFKRDLTTAALVEMALAQLSRAPEVPVQIPAIKVSKSVVDKMPAPSPRMFMSGSPKGLRGPFA
ncbi:MAG: hypothetical protein EB064_01980 [Betaproteobacteria bacterium]|nr:hypothetical protein [Betaproteobacteria bacterium]